MADILVIDDDKDILMLMAFILKRAGHQVITCVNGQQALSYLETDMPPDLIIVDVMMPGMSGYEFCQKLRSRPPLHTVPVIIFSAHYHSSGRKTALEAGANEYLPKTTPPDALVRYIRNLLPATS